MFSDKTVKGVLETISFACCLLSLDHPTDRPEQETTIMLHLCVCVFVFYIPKIRLSHDSNCGADNGNVGA